MFDRNKAITGKLICVDRGEAPDNSARHLVMVVGVLAIPKEGKIYEEINKEKNISVGMLEGYNGALTLSHLNNLGLPEDEDPEDWKWLRKENASSLLTSYEHWQV